ncbi:RNA polymerase sigma factor [Brachybacterium tyrofermentans]|uniref:RNA polymerase sigma factor n=1 Tax=Brachybacterium tyrofermentans TaxID=47848 RepID=UPI000A1B3047|nr:RNA polymerase sigma factor [Brachybacterium tyrofermentans]SLN00654.1 RNA polymerase sigma-70 factor, ECF subfamily [Corynebacterium xerosis]
MRGGNAEASGSDDEAALSRAALKAAGGDSAALEELVETLDRLRIVQRMVGSMLLDLDAVDDVSQEVLISIMGSIRQYRGVGKFSTWVHPIAKRRVADHLRRQRDATALEETDLPAQRFSSMVASRTALRAALAELPEKYQAPLILRDLEQLPVAEIAARLDLPEGTVKAQISRGRAKLETILGAIE